MPPRRIRYATHVWMHAQQGGDFSNRVDPRSCKEHPVSECKCGKTSNCKGVMRYFRQCPLSLPPIIPYLRPKFHWHNCTWSRINMTARRVNRISTDIRNGGMPYFIRDRNAGSVLIQLGPVS